MPPIRKKDGGWARGDQEKCNIFDTFLKQFFQPHEFAGGVNNFENQ